MNNEHFQQRQGLARLGLDQAGVRVLVVGLGVTGLSVINFLRDNHVEVAAVDSRENPQGLVTLEEDFKDIVVFMSRFGTR